MHFLFCACATKLQTNPCTREEKTLEDGRVKPKLDSTLSDIGSEGMCRVTKNVSPFATLRIIWDTRSGVLGARSGV